MTSDDIAALAAEFRGWHVWRGRSGAGIETDWHATASRDLREAGAQGRLTAGSAPGLRALLRQQEALMRSVAA